MKKIFYERVGRKYVPVYEHDNDLLDSFSKGTHLVMVYPGGKSTRYNVDPNYAAMIAAGRVAEDEICRAMFVASEAKPKERPITERQRAAWEEMKAAFGDEFFSIQFASTRDIAEAAVNAMQAEAERLMTYPAVQEAYDHFMTVVKLCSKGDDSV